MKPARLAAALWDYRESKDPSGLDADYKWPADPDAPRRRPVYWEEACREDLWPGSREEALAEAADVLTMLGIVDQPFKAVDAPIAGCRADGVCPTQDMCRDFQACCWPRPIEVTRLEALALARYELACRYEREAEHLRERVASLMLEEPSKTQGLYAAIDELQEAYDRYRSALVCIADMSFSPYGDLRKIARAALNEDTDR